MKRTTVILIIIILSGVFLRLIGALPQITLPESHYIYFAGNISNFYRSSSSIPISIILVTKLSNLMFGNNLFGLRLLSFVSGIGLVVVSYLLGKLLFTKEKSALILSAVVATNNFFVLQSKVNSPDSFGLLFLVISLYSLIKWIKYKSNKQFFYFTIFYILAVFFKINYFVVLISGIVYPVLSEGIAVFKKRELVASLIVIIAFHLALVEILPYHNKTENLELKLRMDYTYLVNSFGFANFIFFVVLFLCGVYLTVKEKSELFLLFTVLISTVVLSPLLLTASQRYLELIILPLLCFSLSVFDRYDNKLFMLIFIALLAGSFGSTCRSGTMLREFLVSQQFYNAGVGRSQEENAIYTKTALIDVFEGFAASRGKIKFIFDEIETEKPSVIVSDLKVFLLLIPKIEFDTKIHGIYYINNSDYEQDNLLIKKIYCPIFKEKKFDFSKVIVFAFKEKSNVWNKEFTEMGFQLKKYLKSPEYSYNFTYKINETTKVMINDITYLMESKDFIEYELNNIYALTFEKENLSTDGEVSLNNFLLSGCNG